MSTDRDVVVGSLTDPGMFGLLFQRHSERIFRYAAKRIGSDAAEDVMSETFVVAFRRRAGFDRGREDAAPWLFGIATVLIRRRRAAEAQVLRALEASRAAFVEGDDAGQSVIERLDAERRVDGLAPAIAALPRRDRDTLFLYAWADLDYEGVAAALGIPVGTVRSRLNRVRRKLAAAAEEAAIRGSTDGRDDTGMRAATSTSRRTRTITDTSTSTNTNTSRKGEGDGRLGERAQSAL